MGFWKWFGAPSDAPEVEPPAFNVAVGNPTPLDDEARIARARRAKEILLEASWLWDEYVSEQNRALLGTLPADVEGREECYRRIAVAAELKGHLLSICNYETYLEKRNERANR